jgi:MoaA/NifB/PqqE/SkfB family radical SAM enzyme
MQTLGTRLGKFQDSAFTAEGQARACVAIDKLHTLWINTGTLCNLSCANCYIESSPVNNRLSYISRAEVRAYLEEAAALDLPLTLIGITGGEPFMNPDLPGIMEDCLDGGLSVLVLTNAMRPMMKARGALKGLRERYPDKLTLRVSLDHFEPGLHEEERGRSSWGPAIDGLKWLAEEGFNVHIAGRTRWGDNEKLLREGFAELFADLGVQIDAFDPQVVVLFPEMDSTMDVPEITEQCWQILDVEPASLMCASSRMIVKRRGAAVPEVVSCTLLPYDPEFSLGRSLAQSLRPIALNHPHCAKFCVLGGASCGSVAEG